MNCPQKKEPQVLGRLGVPESVRAGQGANGAMATPDDASALCLPLALLDFAIALLDRVSLESDTPAPGVVEAADSLDAARAGLLRAMTGGPRHDGN